MPKLRPEEERLTNGAIPVPARLITLAVSAALSVMVTAPVLLPVVVGLKVTEMVQLAPGATRAGERGQLSVSAKSPVATMLVIVIADEV